MTVLVCGGRDYADYPRVCAVLDQRLAVSPTMFVRHGAARGADSLAHRWAISRGIVVERYPADWLRYGRSAGLRRNAVMLADGSVALVIAFPGGRGTQDMIRRAQSMYIPVEAVQP